MKVGFAAMCPVNKSLSEEKYLALILEISNKLNSSLDLQQVLTMAMDHIVELLDAERGFIMLLENGKLELKVMQGFEEAGILEGKEISRGVIDQVMSSGEGVVTFDAMDDQRFSQRESVCIYGLRSVLCVPLKTKDNILGVMYLCNRMKSGIFDDRDKAILKTVANQAANAMENAMLHRQIIENERLTAIGQTMAGLAHCIKNVLHGIQNGQYVVDTGIQKKDFTFLGRGWSIVKRNLAFMQDLVLDMLTYAKEREPEYESCDMNVIGDAVCTLLREKAAAKQVQIDFIPCLELNDVVIDPKGIQRSLLNLVTNAVDACKSNSDGRVRVKLDTLPDEQFRILVQDNGMGISTADQQNLFKMFYSTKGARGTGIGLAVTHKIIQEHQGCVRVESSLGKGSSFIVELPRHR